MTEKIRSEFGAKNRIKNTEWALPKWCIALLQSPRQFLQVGWSMQTVGAVWLERGLPDLPGSDPCWPQIAQSSGGKSNPTPPHTYSERNKDSKGFTIFCQVNSVGLYFLTLRVWDAVLEVGSSQWAQPPRGVSPGRLPSLTWLPPLNPSHGTVAPPRGQLGSSPHPERTKAVITDQ